MYVNPFLKDFEQHLNALDKSHRVSLCILVCMRLRACVLEYDRISDTNKTYSFDDVIEKLWQYAMCQSIDTCFLRKNIEEQLSGAEDSSHPLMPYVVDAFCMLTYIIRYIDSNGSGELLHVCGLMYDSLSMFVEDSIYGLSTTIGANFDVMTRQVNNSKWFKLEQERQMRDFLILNECSKIDTYFVQNIISSHKDECCVGDLKSVYG